MARYEGFLGDSTNKNCTEHECIELTKLFIDIILPKFAATLARKADYELSDFASSKKLYVDEFSLTINKIINGKEVSYKGIFHNGDKKLEIESFIKLTF